jgi:hypothetical protein
MGKRESGMLRPVNACFTPTTVTDFSRNKARAAQQSKLSKRNAGVKQALTGPRHYTTCSYRDLREPVIDVPGGCASELKNQALRIPLKTLRYSCTIAIGGGCLRELLQKRG